ncbi:Hsp33 family molecular chaperone HslO [Fructilactobacillus myrtifloralis]|uniref:33 kDa chaperonin n=1 Tax=Fructilactobacillus myrtifloralis TaxID=2940301 RepID=A0ABY5BPL1_9LACO|nr:Hsp33 family molecular chaperone HslO [Fructilactobacillus myrtifloralis]USS84891.1 Hsp33 family molecular chaperone HslO [Fructilactobacillus myrtifloralis]
MTKTNDQLVKALTTDNNFRVLAVNATGVVQTAQQNHDLHRTATAALGRTLVASLLLANSTLKGKEGLTVRLNGQGPLGGMIVDADAAGHVKGYVQHPDVDLPQTDKQEEDVATAVGTDGFLEVLKNQGGAQPYASSVPLVSGKIGDDFTYYLAKSEQIPSALGVSVAFTTDDHVAVAGGYLIQTLPGADETAITELEKRLQTLPSIATSLQENPDPAQLINTIFGAEHVKILDHLPVSFYCDCSKEKFAHSLAGIGRKDLQQLIDEDHGAEVVCNFCGQKYDFSEADLVQILNDQAKDDENDE